MATDPLAMLRGLMGGGFAQPQGMGPAPAPQMGGSFLPTGYTPPQGPQMMGSRQGMPGGIFGGGGQTISPDQLSQLLGRGGRNPDGSPHTGDEAYFTGNPSGNIGGQPANQQQIQNALGGLFGGGSQPQQFGAQMPSRMGTGQGMSMGGQSQGQPLSRLFQGNGRMYRYQG